MSEPTEKVKEILEQVKSLSREERKLFRDWIDAWINLTHVEEKIKALRKEPESKP